MNASGVERNWESDVVHVFHELMSERCMSAAFDFAPSALRCLQPQFDGEHRGVPENFGCARAVSNVCVYPMRHGNVSHALHLISTGEPRVTWLDTSGRAMPRTVCMERDDLRLSQFLLVRVHDIFECYSVSEDGYLEARAAVRHVTMTSGSYTWMFSCSGCTILKGVHTLDAAHDVLIQTHKRRKLICAEAIDDAIERLCDGGMCWGDVMELFGDALPKVPQTKSRAHFSTYVRSGYSLGELEDMAVSLLKFG